MITWDILIPTIPHRDAELRRLLAELDTQWQEGLGVVINRDNLERKGNASYAKWQELMEFSKAEYVCIAGDDDMVAPNFVRRVMAALEEKPDYVGFPVRYTLDGVLQQPCEHSLRYGTWIDSGQMIMRDIVHQNPIRRELALQSPWNAEVLEEDRKWAGRLREQQLVRTEVWIDEPMYYYQASKGNDFSSERGPMPEANIPPPPSYPWLTSMGSV